MKITIGVTMDCQNIGLLAGFWRDALGYDEPVPVDAKSSFHALVAPDGGLHHLTFQLVPERKTVKNRVHLDLFVDDLEGEVIRLEGLGATTVAKHNDDGYRTAILADPEHNEFCVVQQGD